MIDWTAEADRLRRELPVDSYVLRAGDEARKRFAQGHIAAPPVRTVRQAVTEQRIWALATLTGLQPIYTGGDNQQELVPYEERPEVYDRIGTMIAQGTPYLWFTPIWNLVNQYNLPKHIIAPDLPHPVMFWTFEGSIPIEIDGKEIGMMESMLLYQEMGHLYFCLIGANTQASTAGWTIQKKVRIGATYPEGSTALGRTVLGALAFLNSPYVETVKQLSHPKGAKVKWHGRRIGDPVALHVVRLRSSVQEAVAVEKGEGPKWKSRWLVRGHYRAQWYPSINAHKVIWIAPYLKGPEDAPLEQQVYAVVR